MVVVGWVGSSGGWGVWSGGGPTNYLVSPNSNKIEVGCDIGKYQRQADFSKRVFEDVWVANGNRQALKTLNIPVNALKSCKTGFTRILHT